MLARLLDELDRVDAPVTAIELAMRLGTTSDEVKGMITSLRSAGRLGPPPDEPRNECASAGGCTLSCPGPARCGLVVDPAIRLEVRR